MTPHYITYNGVTDHMAGWSKRLGLAPITVGKRLRAGWTIDRALSTNPGRTPQKGHRVRASVIEDAELLADTGVTLEQAANRIGYTNPLCLERALYRAGRGDLASKLRRNGRRQP